MDPTNIAYYCERLFMWVGTLCISWGGYKHAQSSGYSNILWEHYGPGSAGFLSLPGALWRGHTIDGSPASEATDTRDGQALKAANHRHPDTAEDEPTLEDYFRPVFPQAVTIFRTPPASTETVLYQSHVWYTQNPEASSASTWLLCGFLSLMIFMGFRCHRLYAKKRGDTHQYYYHMPVEVQVVHVPGTVRGQDKNLESSSPCSGDPRPTENLRMQHHHNAFD